MKYNPDIHHRCSLRYKEYDYSNPGCYFITICTYGQECLFGTVIKDKMILNKFGKIAEDEWLKTPIIRENFDLDDFIIMPNHLHGIVIITDRVIKAANNDELVNNENGLINNNAILATNKFVRANGRSPLQNRSPLQTRSHVQNHSSIQIRMAPKSISSFVSGYKSTVTKQINEMRKTPFIPVWQRSFYDHIIHNEPDLNRIREYIRNNPHNWQSDRNNIILANQ